MNRKGMNWLALGGALALAACGNAPAAAPPLEGASLGGPFRLTGETGRPFTQADLQGRYRIMYFGFASCPDVCPTDLAVIGQGLKQFEKANGARGAKVTPVFVSVDYTRDTPATLKTYTDAFHPRLVGATGDKAAIDAVTKAYGAAYSVEPGATPDATVVNHSRTAILYGPDGKPIALLPTEQGAGAVAAELDRWVV